MSLFVFDIDGTLADCNHRLHYIKSTPKNWKEFFSNNKNDQPILPMIDLLMQLENNNRSEFEPNQIALATGRPERLRKDTIEWLFEHAGDLSFSLYMRNDYDYRPDVLVKIEQMKMIEQDYKRKIDIWFDDREPIIAALRTHGVFVVNVNQGELYGS
mgnify:CR=1 FL=1